jgi:inositol transport system permease protein
MEPINKVSANITWNGISGVLKKYRIIMVLFSIIVFLSIIKPEFLSPINILNVLTQSSIYGIMAMGVTFIIIAKGIDLSLGSTLAFAGVVAGSFAQSSGAITKYYPNLPVMPIIVPVFAALFIGGLCGFINGFFVAKTRIPAFIATLGMMTIARGAAFIYAKGKPISNLVPSINAVGGKLFNIIPVPVIIYLFVLILCSILLSKTRFGKNTYAIGGNIHAAEVSGINVSKSIILIYTFSGLLVGLAAIVFAGRVGSIHPGAATGYELTTIAGTTIGGTSQSGGIGTIWGAFIGVLVIAVLRNGLTLLGVDSYWQQVVEGIIIISAVIIDMRKNARQN